MDSELIALTTTGKEVEWLTNLLLDIELCQNQCHQFCCIVIVKPQCLEHLAKYIMKNQDILV